MRLAGRFCHLKTRRPEEAARAALRAGPCRFQMAETTCQPQFEPPHHLEWLIRRLSASSIWGRMRFFAGRPVRSWRRVLRFRRAPPGPVLRAFARGWVGSRCRAGKRIGEPILYYHMSLYLEDHLLSNQTAVSRARGALQPCGASRGLPSFWRKSSPIGTWLSTGLASRFGSPCSPFRLRRSVARVCCFRPTPRLVSRRASRD